MVGCINDNNHLISVEARMVIGFVEATAIGRLG